ncbi:MAG: KH domain-containing protein [Candidatus Peregrinibacteria bacterium]
MPSEKQFLEFVLSSLLDSPKELVITETNDTLGTLFEIQVNTEDMGKLIGKGGKTIKALRTLVRMVGSKTEKRVNIRIAEPNL